MPRDGQQENGFHACLGAAGGTDAKEGREQVGGTAVACIVGRGVDELGAQVQDLPRVLCLRG